MGNCLAVVLLLPWRIVSRTQECLLCGSQGTSRSSFGLGMLGGGGGGRIEDDGGIVDVQDGHSWDGACTLPERRVLGGQAQLLLSLLLPQEQAIATFVGVDGVVVSAFLVLEAFRHEGGTGQGISTSTEACSHAAGDHEHSRPS